MKVIGQFRFILPSKEGNVSQPGLYFQQQDILKKVNLWRQQIAQ